MIDPAVEESEAPVEARPMMGAQTAPLNAADPDDPLYVPVTNVNYIPEDAPVDDKGNPQLEGYVPSTPGNDPTLNRIKQALEAQGLESGPIEDKPGNGPHEVPPVTDEPEPEPETTI